MEDNFIKPSNDITGQIEEKPELELLKKIEKNTSILEGLKFADAVSCFKKTANAFLAKEKKIDLEIKKVLAVESKINVKEAKGFARKDKEATSNRAVETHGRASLHLKVKEPAIKTSGIQHEDIIPHADNPEEIEAKEPKKNKEAKVKEPKEIREVKKRKKTKVNDKFKPDAKIKIIRPTDPEYIEKESTPIAIEKPKRDDKGRFIKSQEAIESQKENKKKKEDEKKDQKDNFLKSILNKISDPSKMENTKEATGLAFAGPMWGAISEMQSFGSEVKDMFAGVTDWFGKDKGKESSQKAIENQTDVIQKNEKIEKKRHKQLIETIQGIPVSSSNGGMDLNLGGGLLKTIAGAITGVLPALIGGAGLTGMAALGYKGFNDKELQKKAFHLKDGQEATTGQKASAGLANYMDMGGFVSGAQKMLGLGGEGGTAAIAEGVYSIGQQIVKEPISLIKDVLGWQKSLFTDNIVKPSVEATEKLIKTIDESPFGKKVTETTTNIINYAKDAGSGAKQMAGDAWSAMKGGVSTLWNAIPRVNSDKKGWDSVKDTIVGASQAAGVDPARMARFANVESSFNPNAKAGTSSASGLYQFTDSTWKEMLSKHGEKYGLSQDANVFDPKANTLMAAEFLKQNQQIIEKSTGRKATDTDLYMAHFLGAGGASKFLKGMEANPNELATRYAIGDAIRANQNIFFDKETGRTRTTQEVYGMMRNKIHEGDRIYATEATQIAKSKQSERIEPKPSNEELFAQMVPNLNQQQSAPSQYGPVRDKKTDNEKSTPVIKTEFDDTLLTLFAYDRI
ncbi:MAG: transglycosylase SLT domain-containing protein [Desulfobacterales bacterium]|nr:transglycosylase SLT domain-containing protein [Desulfobacterales bacterium]